jgi:hypothetical protein
MLFGRRSETTGGLSRRAMLKAASLTAAGAAASPFVGASELRQQGLQEAGTRHHEPLHAFKYRIEASEARVTAGEAPVKRMRRNSPSRRAWLASPCG